MTEDHSCKKKIPRNKAKLVVEFKEAAAIEMATRSYILWVEGHIIRTVEVRKCCPKDKIQAMAGSDEEGKMKTGDNPIGIAKDFLIAQLLVEEVHAYPYVGV